MPSFLVFYMYNYSPPGIALCALQGERRGACQVATPSPLPTDIEHTQHHSLKELFFSHCSAVLTMSHSIHMWVSLWVFYLFTLGFHLYFVQCQCGNCSNFILRLDVQEFVSLNFVFLEDCLNYLGPSDSPCKF